MPSTFIRAPLIATEPFARIRAALDAFRPDVIVIWGDDQYENFREDVVPAFCVLAADEYTFNLPQPHDQPNAWGDPPGATLRLAGHRAAGKRLASSLISADFDVAYAYKPLHTTLGHARRDRQRRTCIRESGHGGGNLRRKSDGEPGALAWNAFIDVRDGEFTPAERLVADELRRSVSR